MSIYNFIVPKLLAFGLVLILAGKPIPAFCQNNPEFLTISYSISVRPISKQTLAAESLDGATKNIFLGNNKARIRLVSFMRTQSIYYFAGNTDPQAIIIKESGKTKEKSTLTKAAWKTYQQGFEGLACVLLNETSTILDYPCRKAIIKLADGNQLIAYYTEQLSNKLFREAEPMFACIPGIVLKYEFRSKKNLTTYTAQQISQGPIDEKVFKTE